MELQHRLHETVDRLSAGGPLVVHSDLFTAMRFVPPSKDRAQLLRSHADFLAELAGRSPLWLPAFNYDFLRTGHSSLRDAPCQVGPLGEFYRTERARWRSLDPVFSMCGTGPPPRVAEPPALLDPFGDHSIFAEMVRRRAVVLFYGAPLASATIIHHAERLGGGPAYRYDKRFRGTMVDHAGQRRTVEYLYHVRPMGRTLGYDWDRLENELRRRAILRVVELRGRVVARAVPADALARLWSESMRADPLYLLDADTRAWVAPRLAELGRRFEWTDFE